MPSNLEIIKLNDLHLAARIISQQLRQGIHSGLRVGEGSEFEEYRHYQPGDDFKNIDWRYFSRSGKYMIKKSTIESHLQIRLMLDLSGSMNYSENGFSKLDYAKNLIASLAYLGFLQGDTLCYYTLHEGKIEQKVGGTTKSFQRILLFLEQAKASGSWPLQSISDTHFQGKERELVIWFSDFFQKESEWENILKAFQHPRKELLMVQILGEMELDFKLKGNLVFKDLESGQELVQNSVTMQEDYLKRFRKYLTYLDQTFTGSQVQLIRVSMKDPLAKVIRQILNRRKLT
jgi:uncharacterized protein (DUF58 family)